MAFVTNCALVNPAPLSSVTINAKKKLEKQSVCAGKAAANRLKGASSLMDRITPDRQTASSGCLGNLLVQEWLARREPFILPGCA